MSKKKTGCENHDPTQTESLCECVIRAEERRNLKAIQDQAEAIYGGHIKGSEIVY